MHVLPAGLHRIRYYGLLASGKRADNIARARELLTLSILPVDALFERRPPERVDSSSLPASENLHKARNRVGR
jgi:hypothetical protein